MTLYGIYSVSHILPSHLACTEFCVDVANLTASDDSHIILRPGFLCLYLIFTWQSKAHSVIILAEGNGYQSSWGIGEQTKINLKEDNNKFDSHIPKASHMRELKWSRWKI